MVSRSPSTAKTTSRKRKQVESGGGNGDDQTHDKGLLEAANITGLSEADQQDFPWLQELIRDRLSDNHCTYLLSGPGVNDLFVTKDDKGNDMIVELWELLGYELAKSLEKYSISKTGAKIPVGTAFYCPRSGFTCDPTYEEVKGSLKEIEDILKEKMGDAGGAEIPGAKQRTNSALLPAAPLLAIRSIDLQMSPSPKVNTAQPTLVFMLPEVEALIPGANWHGNSQVNVVVEHIKKIALSEIILAGGLDKNRKSRNTKNTLIMVTSEDPECLHPGIRNPNNRIKNITIDYPGEAQRARLLMSCGIEWENDEQLNRVVQSSGGCMLKQLREFVNDSMKDPGLIESQIWKFRKKVVEESADGMLVVENPRHGREAVGGLQYVFNILDEHVYPFLSRSSCFAPAGILFTGPPGTGKSVTAEAIAYECGIPFVHLRLENMFRWFVGQSENRMERALNLLRAIAPCIAFIDEIDQVGMSRGSFQGDSGVSSRIFKRFLEFLGDDNNRGKMFLIAATNKPSLIDAAMKRTGRLDMRVPFLPGGAEDRADIVRAILTKFDAEFKKDGIQIEVDPLKTAEGMNDQYLGSDIEAAILMATRESFSSGRALTTDAIIEVSEQLQPSVSFKDKKEFLKEALEDCNFTKYIPKKYSAAVERLSGKLSGEAPIGFSTGATTTTLKNSDGKLDSGDEVGTNNNDDDEGTKQSLKCRA